MNAIMELIGVAAGLTALAFVVFGRQRRLRGIQKAAFASLLAIVLLSAALDFSEQVVTGSQLDFMEDYVDIFMPLAWGTFILSLFSQDSANWTPSSARRVFARQLVFALAGLLVLNLILGLAFFMKVRDTFFELDDYHGKAVVAVSEMRSKSSAAIQESFAYVVSGDPIEKEEFESFAQSYEAQAGAVRLINKLDEPAERINLANFEVIIALQKSLVDNARQMFLEFETNGELSAETFHDYEAVVDELDVRMGQLQRSAQASHDASQAAAARMLEDASIEIPLLGGASIVLTGLLFGLLTWGFSRYAREQELAQQELVASEERHRKLLDSLPELIWVSGPDKLCTHFNKTWLQFTGRTMQEELGTGWSEGVHPDDLDNYLEMYESAFDLRKPFTMEYRLRRHDGQYRWIFDAGAPWFEADGRFAGYIGGCIDVTERREAEKSLRQRDQAFRTAITPIAFADLEGRITEANQAFANLFGFESTEQVIGQLNTSFHSEPTSISQINKLILEGGFNGEVTSKRIDGTPIDLQISATRFADANGRPIGSMATFMDVTPRRKVERALRDSEERLRQSEQRLQQLISNCPAALYTCKASGDFGATFVSKTITSQLGYETREFLDDASFWVNHIHPEDREYVLADLSKLFETGHQSYEYRFLHKDGTYRWMYDQSSLLLGSDGNPEEIVGFWMDITEQKRAEEVETNLGRIVEESYDEVYIFDVETQYFLLVNRGARENLGYSMEELKRLTPLDLKPDVSPEIFAEMTQQLRSGEKELVHFVTRHRRKDGSLYDVEVHLQRAMYQGQPVFLAIILDIGDRIKLENALSRRALEAELLYQAVAMADEVDSLDAALEKCLDIVCEMTGWPVGHVYVPSVNGTQQLEPTKIWHLAYEQRFTKFREVTEQTTFAMGEGLPGRIWKTGEPAWIVDLQDDDNCSRNRLCGDLGVKGAFGFPLQLKGETVAILEFFHEGALERNETLLLLVRSVGEQVGRVMERKEAEQQMRRQQELVEQELEKAKEELVLKTRLAAVGQMSAQVAHELRNPLGAVSNAVYYLQRHVPASEEKWSEYLHLIDNEVTTCNRFIGELLDVTRAKAPIRETTNLAHLVERVLTRHDVPQRVDIQLVCDPDPFEIFADNDQIVQVLDNLLQNALDASGQKAARIKIRAYRDAESDIITVQDAGSGIPPEHRASVFDVLFTTKSSGTGLGLPICKQIIEKHGGTIELLDELSPGTTFQIRLPRALVFS